MAVFSWYLGFNPRGPKPTKVPIWVEFHDLPIDYYPWLKQIGSCLGRVLGQRARGGFNPKWEPQMLIEIDLSKNLKTEVPIKVPSGILIHTQRVSYRKFPNACFQCLKQGHHIKDYLELKPTASSVETDPPNKNEGFQPVPKRNTARGGKNAKQGNKRKDTNEQFHEVPPEATDDLQKEDKNLFEDFGFDMDSPNIDLDAGELGSPPLLQKKNLENKDDDEDEEKDEDKEELAGTQGHQGPDDDDDDDDDDDHQDFPGTSPSSRGASNHLLHLLLLNQNPQCPKKCNTTMVSSHKGKEMSIGFADGLLNNVNSWIHKELRLAKESQLKEFLKVDDMYSDMEQIAMLYTREKQVAKSWKMAHYHDRTKCALPKHLVVIQLLDRFLEITVNNAVKDANPWVRQLTTDKISSVGLQVNKLFKRILSQENHILINYFELMPEPPALLYANRMEETKLPRFYPTLYPPHTKPTDQMEYIQIVEWIREWWEKFEGLWNEWKGVINVTKQKKTIKELKARLVDFKVGMRFWKRHMHVLVKHTNALLQLNIEASKIPEKDIENLATNEDTYREIGEILFEARVKANQFEPIGWLYY
ncbi:hypothetical protein L7F22_034605 [Adiantum nelumboides]|nr:hypothetical protein [Adiantum nelumboides]